MPQAQTDTTTTTESTIQIDQPTRIEEEQAGPSASIENFDYDAYLAAEQVKLDANKGKKVLPDDEPIDIAKLQKRVFELEQESLSHTIMIQELRTDNEEKDKKIKSLETDMGLLSAIVYDLKEKLQNKFQGEFADEPNPATASASTSAPEVSRTDFEDMTKRHEEGLRKYFAGGTGFLVSTSKFRELMIIKDRIAQEARDAMQFKPTRFQVDVEDSRYNYEGDRSGIRCWGYDDIKGMWWVRRALTKRIEYYDHPLSFNSFTMVDMTELSRKSFFNPSNSRRGESFYNNLQRHAKKGFSDMVLAQSMTTKKLTTNSLGNPLNFEAYEVKWPPTQRVKKVPILPDMPEGSLDNFRFWAFDEQIYGVIINCGDAEYSFYDPIDLMCLSEKDIKFLSDQDIKVDQDHLQDALEFEVYVKTIVRTEAWSGAHENVSSFMFSSGDSEAVEEVEEGQEAKDKEAHETQN